MFSYPIDVLEINTEAHFCDVGSPSLIKLKELFTRSKSMIRRGLRGSFRRQKMFRMTTYEKSKK